MAKKKATSPKTVNYYTVQRVSGGYVLAAVTVTDGSDGMPSLVLGNKVLCEPDVKAIALSKLNLAIQADLDKGEN